jgi:hypothetical protein
MKKIIKGGIIILMTALLCPQTVQAQGTLEVSDFGQTLNGAMSVGSDSWIETTFFTGYSSDGFTLNSVQLLMNAASGNPSGFSVMIYDSSANSIGSLNGSSNPSTAGIYSYSASGITLLQRTLYAVVVTAATPVANGTYNWAFSNNDNGAVNNSWSISGIYYPSIDGVNLGPRGFVDLQFAIHATAIPEPSPVSLLFLGTGILFYGRRRNNPSANLFTFHR